MADCTGYPTAQDALDWKKNADDTQTFGNSDDQRMTWQTSGKETYTIQGLQDYAVEAARSAGGVKKGNYNDNPLLEDNVEYAYHVATQKSYKIAAGVTPPYQVDSATYPDPELDPNLVDFRYLNQESIPGITNLQSSSVDNLILGAVIGGDTYNHEVGQVWSTGGTFWKINGTSPVTSGFIDVGNGLGAFPINELYMEDFGAVADLYLDGDVRNQAPTDNLTAFNQALSLDYYPLVWGKGSYWISSGVSIKRGFSMRGKGARKRLPTRAENCTSLVFDLAQNEDALTYTPGGYPEGDVLMQDLQIVHDISVLDFAGIIDGKNRGIFGNDLTQGWFEDEKAGGSLLPTLRLVNVFFSGFWCGVDVHTWMSYFDNVRSDYCGHTIRSLGTSLFMRGIWPQHPLLSPYQLKMIYSTLEASSLGETSVSGYTELTTALELKRCAITINGCGAEKCDFDSLVSMEDSDVIIDGLDIAESPAAAVPKFIFNFTGNNRRLQISNTYNENTFSDSYMKSEVVSWTANTQHLTPLYPEYNDRFNVYERVRNSTGGTDFYKGIFGSLAGNVSESQYLPYDSDTTNYDASHLFDNLWEVGDFVSESGWTNLTGGSFEVNTADGSRLGHVVGTSTITNNNFYYEFTVAGGEMIMFATQGGASVEIGRFSDGTHYVPLVNTESGIWFVCNDVGATISSVTLNQNGLPCDVLTNFDCNMVQANRNISILVNTDGWKIGDRATWYVDFSPSIGINNAGASVVYPSSFVDGHVIASINKNKTSFGINARSTSSLQFGNPSPVIGNATYGDYAVFSVRADSAEVTEKRGLVGTYKGWVRSSMPSGSTGLGRFGVQIQRDPVA